MPTTPDARAALPMAAQVVTSATSPPLPEVGIGWRHAHHGELLQRRPPLGFVEVHSENFFADGGAALAVLAEGRAIYPVSLHGVGLGLGSAAGIDRWHLDRLARLVERIDPVRVSDHACFARGPLRPGGAMVHAADLLPVAFTEASLAIKVDQVQQVQDRLKRTLLVENLAACLRWSDDSMTEAEFLNALARRSGCGLLLDVNNLVVAALNAAASGPGEASPEQSACRVIDAIDPSLVGEIHLAGHDASGALVIDHHGCRVQPMVWRVFEHALARLGPRPTLVEWDTDIPSLEVLLDEAALAGGAIRRSMQAAAGPGAVVRPVPGPATTGLRPAGAAGTAA